MIFAKSRSRVGASMVFKCRGWPGRSRIRPKIVKLREKLAKMKIKKPERGNKKEKTQPRSLQERPGVPRELEKGPQHKPVLAREREARKMITNFFTCFA